MAAFGAACVLCALGWIAATILLRHPLADDPAFQRIVRPGGGWLMRRIPPG